MKLQLTETLLVCKALTYIRKGVFMDKAFIVAVALVAFVIPLTAQEPQQQRAMFSITGYVTDNDGQLVTGAQVQVMPVDRGGLIITGTTTAGRFSLPMDRPGTYRVYAFKDDKGYRMISEALFALDPEGTPEVVITERSPAQMASIRMRSEGASLIVRLTDKVTGRPLESAKLVLRRQDDPNLQYIRSLTSFTKKGEIKLLLPSLPLRLEASAPGYESWSLSELDSKEKRGTLLLTPGETREITIALRPLNKGQ